MIGAYYYVNHPLYPVKQTHGVLNIDMLGRVDTFYSGHRPDSNYVYIIVIDSVKGFRNSLSKANESLTKLKLDSYYEQPANIKRWLTGSDQFPFWVQGVPFIRIDCGFAKEYHHPEDTPDKINYPLLTEQTKLTFLTLWNMANEQFFLLVWRPTRRTRAVYITPNFSNPFQIPLLSVSSVT